MASISLSEILTRERNRLSEKKTNVDTTLAAQGRLMTLNDSYRKRYSRYTQMIAVFVFATIGFLLVSAIPRVAPFFPKFLIDVMSLAIILYAAYLIFSMYMEINSRSNTNYDELDLPPSVDVSGNMMALDIGQKNKTEWSLGDISELLAKYSINTCFGGDCCPTGYVYSSTSNKCVEASTDPAAGTPAAGTPAAGTPAAGTPAAGTPAAGTPAAGTPAAGTPAAGTPAAGTPAGGGTAGFTLMSDVFPRDLGSQAVTGRFTTVGEQFVEPRFLAPPIQ
jgi:hypothetical protein